MKRRRARRTFDKTPARPLHLRGDDSLGRDGAGPHDARPDLDRKCTATGYIRSSHRCKHSKIVFGISVYCLIPDFTPGLFRTQASVERLHVRHIPRKEFRSRLKGDPVRRPNLCKECQPRVPLLDIGPTYKLLLRHEVLDKTTGEH